MGNNYKLEVKKITKNIKNCTDTVPSYDFPEIVDFIDRSTTGEIIQGYAFSLFKDKEFGSNTELENKKIIALAKIALEQKWSTSEYFCGFNFIFHSNGRVAIGSNFEEIVKNFEEYAEAYGDYLQKYSVCNELHFSLTSTLSNNKAED